MKYLPCYESGPDVATRGPALMPAHRARIDEFHERGTLPMLGTLGDPRRDGALALFTTREAAEEFARTTRSCGTGWSAPGTSRSERTSSHFDVVTILCYHR
ncbi:MAG TPA: hypothetical protein VJT49_30275 [Amycolatopsis sp.]|uniref:YciI family protein n=1 Tax=Amycolatopsis sp. TaxID=37632 RepID=UPI002B47922E|nr:hypothetical protein [Amycolatopsis sp.]HKS49320.1 hypothetical protein [Amycolatopsis sp.]